MKIAKKNQFMILDSRNRPSPIPVCLPFNYASRRSRAANNCPHNSEPNPTEKPTFQPCEGMVHDFTQLPQVPSCLSNCHTWGLKQALTLELDADCCSQPNQIACSTFHTFYRLAKSVLLFDGSKCAFKSCAFFGASNFIPGGGISFEQESKQEMGS